LAGAAANELPGRIQEDVVALEEELGEADPAGVGIEEEDRRVELN